MASATVSNVYPGQPGGALGNNTFIPASVSADLLLGYSKNVKDFAINRYAQHVPVERSAFLIPQWNSIEGARVTNTNRYKWGAGQPAPAGLGEGGQFSFTEYQTQRWCFPTTLDLKSNSQASFDLQAADFSVLGQRAMTMRTIDALSTFANSGAPSATATVFGGGKMDAGTPTTPYARNVIGAVGVAINLATSGAVKPSQLIMTMAPQTAIDIGSSVELTDYLKYMVGWQAYKGDGDVMPGGGFFLDGVSLFGVEVVVEDTVYTNSAVQATTDTMQYVVPASTVYFMSRSGGLEGVEGSRSWSTLGLYFYEEFTTFAYTDPRNRVVELQIISDYLPVVPTQGAKASAIVTAATAS